MFFPIAADEWSKALGQIRRLRHSGSLKRIGSSDLYWSTTFLAALVDCVDSFLLEKPKVAFELSTEGILVAERIRAESCPGGNAMGKRSLQAWAHAVHGSSCRALGRFREAESEFMTALQLVKLRVQRWAAAEAWRRYAALLLERDSLAGIDFVDKAYDAYTGFPGAQADALVLRGLFSQYLEHQIGAAATYTGAAIELLETRRSEREARTWGIAIHNLMVIYSRKPSDLPALQITLQRVKAAQARLSRHEPRRRMLCLWVQALLLAPLGSTRQAERLLVKAAGWFLRNRFLQQGLPCLTDLAMLHFRCGEQAAALATLAEIAAVAADSAPGQRNYVDKHLAEFSQKGLNEESFATLRDALLAINQVDPDADQPLGMIDSAISGSAAGTDGAPESPPGVGSTGAKEEPLGTIDGPYSGSAAGAAGTTDPPSGV